MTGKTEQSRAESLLECLENWFNSIPGTVTAFSGGIDSALVLYLSNRVLRDRAIGCISVSPSLKRRDYAEAIVFCERFSIRLEIIETEEIKDPSYAANPANRCWYCKSHLYEALGRVAAQYPKSMILNGTNLDDLKDYRPGLQAANEFRIRSPLAECEMTKSDVRLLARFLKLPNWQKPASPCLSSRIPYGEPVTLAKLNQIEQSEDYLNQLGFDDVRVRHHGEQARIEVPVGQVSRLQELLPEIEKELSKLGFKHCHVDLEGLVSGKLNRVLQIVENSDAASIPKPQ